MLSALRSLRSYLSVLDLRELVASFGRMFEAGSRRIELFLCKSIFAFKLTKIVIDHHLWIPIIGPPVLFAIRGSRNK